MATFGKKNKHYTQQGLGLMQAKTRAIRQ